MDEWPLVNLSERKIHGLSLLYAAARTSMTTGARLYAAMMLDEYFATIEGFIDHSARNPLDHTRSKK